MTASPMIFGIDALNQARVNPYRMYTFNAASEQNAGTRIANNVFCPINHSPKFKLQKSDLFFTSGSCFAREIELALLELGMSLAGEQHTFPYSWFTTNHSRLPGKESDAEGPVARQRSPINRYSVHSMLYDLERVLEQKHSFEDTIIFLEERQVVWDPQIKNLMQQDRHFAESARGVLDRIVESIVEADVVVFTLGMTETWHDNESGAVLPTPPSVRILKQFPERFSFFNATYEDISSTLDSIVDKVDQHCGKKPKIILTVSPVPLSMTFTDKDVIVANSYSKSTLVSAAQSAARRFDHVDYFPSYDMVQNSAREIWYDDRIHIREEYVSQIMKSFIAGYIE